MKAKKSAIVLAILVPTIAVGLWLLSPFSPYQICLRHSQAEGIKSGMPADSALAYAEALCSSKLPLHKGPDEE